MAEANEAAFEGQGTLPNLIVIGAMKCATTSLHNYLGVHPQIQMSRPKELNFFAEGRNWSRGVSWYASHFSSRTTVNGESSPLYTTYPSHPEAPSLMHSVVPEAKLIYLVRDPIQRMVSHYVHALADGRERRPVEEALTASEENPYLERSLYWTQLQRYLAHHPASRILIIQTEVLRARRRDTLRRVFEFLDVDPGFDSWRFLLERHRARHKRRKNQLGRKLDGSTPLRWLRRIPNHLRWPVEDAILYPFSRKIRRPTVSEELRCSLRERLADEVESLREFKGEDFREWSFATR